MPKMLRLSFFAVIVSSGFAAPSRPNFIFILADDWGWGDAGFNDASVRYTPNLDRWAKQGVIFSDFHTASPVCSPSRTGFMTGREPARFSIHTALNNNWTANAAQGQADYLPPETVTITRLLHQAGYRVGHFGKWHLGSGHSDQGTNRSAPLPSAYGIDASCTFNSNDLCQADGGTFNTSIDIVSRSEAFIRDAKSSGSPFYLNLWLHVSHDRLDPSLEMKAASPVTCRQKNYATNQTVCPRNVFTAAQQDADAQLGKLNTLLGALDLHESTLIFFATDNGPEEQLVYFNAQGKTGPFRGRKRSLYEGGTRVPSFATWGGGTPRPTIRAGGVEHTPMSACDWLPTVASLAGVAVPTGMELDGEDMSRVFLRNTTGTRLPVRRSKRMFWEWRYGVSGPCENVAPALAVRDDEWKFLCNADGSRPELYRLDLFNSSRRASTPPDFHEEMNLAAAYPQKVDELKKALLAWRQTLPSPCAHYATSPSCNEFSSGVYPFGSTPLATSSETLPDKHSAHDSDPDFWIDAQGNVNYW